MIFKFEFEGKTLSANVPKNWNEVTVKQLQGMNFKQWDGRDVVELLSILSGADLQALYATESKPMEAVFTAMEFLKEPPPDWTAIKHAKYLTFWGKDFWVPYDLESEAFGLMIEFQQMAEENNIAAICALYMQPVIDKRIDKKRRAAIEKYILKMPILDILPVVNFFFMKSKEYLIYGKPVLNLSPKPQSKKKTLSFGRMLRKVFS